MRIFLIMNVTLEWPPGGARHTDVPAAAITRTPHFAALNAGFLLNTPQSAPVSTGTRYQVAYTVCLGGQCFVDPKTRRGTRYNTSDTLALAGWVTILVVSTRGPLATTGT